MPCKDIYAILGGDMDCYSNSSVAFENGKKFVINNRSKKSICKIHIDNCLFKDNNIRKCDFFFAIKEDQKFYLVELKGQSLDDAVEQIKSTFDILNSKIKKRTQDFIGVIVSSAVPKAADQKFKTLQQKIFKEHKLMIKRKQIHYEEVV
ncbi:hypothetical protein [Sphingobacterium siyangense]|uniref:Uncharacterized protein n=1 Tax=Sphingobacterium siyangense TaxID=459529 RepID=A0A562M6S7_9SPHI|nr:hypothetical protein [Sphingobacterium siyangense]TWI15646.1 hypothetical protein IQ31_04929 [Sphingobacterium siyangense]